MRDTAARSRTGLTEAAAAQSDVDSRISVTYEHLYRLEGQARSLSFLPRQPARSVLNGRHASRLRGRGLNFEELRGYLPGDDIRTIDWKVTARTREPHVRVYTEERDRPALILVDQRMSMFFGSRLNMKSVTAAEAAAIAAFRILDQGDRVGGVVFGDQILADIRPKRSRRALNTFLQRVARANAELHASASSGPAMSLNDPLEAAARLARRDHLVIVISDFDGVDDHTERLIGGMAVHNDVVLVLVTDPMSQHIDDDFHIVASDGDLQVDIDTGKGVVRQALSNFLEGRLSEIVGWGQKLGIPILPLTASEPTVPQVRRLLGSPAG